MEVRVEKKYWKRIWRSKVLNLSLPIPLLRVEILIIPIVRKQFGDFQKIYTYIYFFKLTVQPKRVGQPSRNIKVLLGFFPPSLGPASSSMNFSIWKEWHCFSFWMVKVSVDIIDEPVHRAILSNRWSFISATKVIPLARIASCTSRDTVFSTNITFGWHTSIISITDFRRSSSCRNKVLINDDNNAFIYFVQTFHIIFDVVLPVSLFQMMRAHWKLVRAYHALRVASGSCI